MPSLINWMTDPLGSACTWVIEKAFDGWGNCMGLVLSNGSMTDGLWNATGDLVNKVAGMMAVVSVGAGAIGIVRGMMSGKIGDVVKSFFLTVMSWPLTVLLLYCASALVTFSDGVSGKIVSSGGTANGLETIKGFHFDSNIVSHQVGLVGALLVGLAIVFGEIVLNITMGARLLLLVLAFGMAPAAIMLVGYDRMRENVMRWLSFVVGLALFKPVIAIIMYATQEIMVAAQEANAGILAYFAAIAGMLVCSFAPWKIIKHVTQFVPGASGITAVAGAGQSGTNAVKKGAQAVASVAIAAATGGAGAALQTGAGQLGLGSQGPQGLNPYGYPKPESPDGGHDSQGGDSKSHGGPDNGPGTGPNNGTGAPTTPAAPSSVATAVADAGQPKEGGMKSTADTVAGMADAAKAAAGRLGPHGPSEGSGDGKAADTQPVIRTPDNTRDANGGQQAGPQAAQPGAQPAQGRDGRDGKDAAQAAQQQAPAPGQPVIQVHQQEHGGEQTVHVDVDSTVHVDGNGR